MSPDILYDLIRTLQEINEIHEHIQLIADNTGMNPIDILNILYNMFNNIPF